MMLALKLGRTLGELGRTMSSHEFALWLAYYPEDMWGEQRDYERAGIIAAEVANYAGRMRKEGTEPARPSDYMPQLKAKAEPVEPDPVAYFTAVAKRNFKAKK